VSNPRSVGGVGSAKRTRFADLVSDRKVRVQVQTPHMVGDTEKLVSCQILEVKRERWFDDRFCHEADGIRQGCRQAFARRAMR
jgi:hypothetical protein